MSLEDIYSEVYSDKEHKSSKTISDLYEESINGTPSINENGQATLNEAYESLLIGDVEEGPKALNSIEDYYNLVQESKTIKDEESDTSLYLS